MSVTEHGNEVVNLPVIYPVWFYNDQNKAIVTDFAIESVHFLGLLIESGYFDGLAQYGVSKPTSAAFTNPSQYLNTHCIRWDAPPTLDKDVIEDNLRTMISSGLIPDPPQTDTPGPVFVLYMPAGIEITKNGESSVKPTKTGGVLGLGSTDNKPFNGFHGSTNSSGVSGEENVFYCVITWPAGAQTLLPAPLSKTDPRFQALVDTWTTVTTHELAEAFTERDGDGWRRGSKELCDLCQANKGAKIVRSSDGTTYKVERYWRNDLGACWPPGSLVVTSPAPPAPRPARPHSCAAGGEHDHRGSAEYLVLHGIAGPGEEDRWRLCRKCNGLSLGWSTLATGACPKGGTHDHSGSLRYVVSHNPTPHAQANWRWCKKCDVLSFTDAGPCAAGGAHDHSASANYVLREGKPQRTGDQDGWRWCRKCQGLIFDGIDPGKWYNPPPPFPAPKKKPPHV